MKTFALVVLVFLLPNCCGTSNKIIYSYKGTVITRIDECGKTSFTYKNKLNQNAGTIWAEYSGINDGFIGYLKFEEDEKVFLLSGDGYFQSEELDTTKFEYRRIYAYNSPEIGKNVCYIMLSTRYEQENNKTENSGVKVEYHLTE